MPRVSSRSRTWGLMMAKRLAFTTHGGLSAVDLAPYDTGRLPHEWPDQYRTDVKDPGVTYVVLSYATPIGWVRADGEVVIPDETYSITTMRHQNLARLWL